MSGMKPIRAILAPLSLFLFVVYGCTAEGYREEADTEVYDILKEKRLSAVGQTYDEAPEFVVEAKVDSLRKRLLEEIKAGVKPQLEISLEDALNIAAENSDPFQSQRESLYRAALALTTQRNRYSTIWSGGGDASSRGVGENGETIGRGGADVSASKILSSGATILGSFVSSFFKVFTSGGGWDATSLLSMAITQPLLQGFGKIATMEPLTQSERDAVYSIRNYERFRRDFCITVVAEYLAVIEEQNNLTNQVANTKSLVDNRKQAMDMSLAGRMQRFEVDQALQQELTATDNELASRTRLKTTLDRFKATLGIPIETELTLRSGALKAMQDFGVGALDLGEDEAFEIALQNRLDLKNRTEAVEDRARKILVAENALKMGLDLSAAVDVPNTTLSNPAKLDWRKFQWQVGIELDLPLNRVPQRNVYRSALIDYDAEARGLSHFIDTIKREIRISIRNLNQARRSYEIQQNSLSLAEVRVDSTKLLVDAGRAQMRDFLNSQDDLLEAQTRLTAALVNYVVTKLELLNDLQLLEVGESGLSLDIIAMSSWRRADKPEVRLKGMDDSPEAAKPGTDPKGTDPRATEPGTGPEGTGPEGTGPKAEQGQDPKQDPGKEEKE
jgi:outer membrane protein TolC